MESLEATCPHCEHPTTSRGVAPGGIIDCVHCDRSFVLSQSPELVEPDPGSAIPRGRGVALDTRFPQLSSVQSAAPTDVSLAASALAAAGLTLLFYVALVRPLQGSYISELFGQRGWVPYVIAWLSSWSAVLLLVKWRLLARQRESLALDLLPEAIATRITPDNAHIFASVARHLSERNAGSFLCRRVLGAVQHFRARRQVQEVADQLEHQAQADADAVDASYTMLRVFIWAIPILGFIGTVLGIGAAVGAFSDSVSAAVDLEVMKQSIGGVTLGLGVAFDTTLLALVMSILIMFPTSSLQKAEEQFLARVSQYCEQRLLRRLQDGREPDPVSAQRLDVELSRLSGVLESLERRLAADQGA